MALVEERVQPEGPADGSHAVPDRRSRLVALLGSRKILVVAIVVGVLLRLAAGIVIGQGGEIHEFGVIGQNIESGRGYSYFSVGTDGTVERDFDHTGRPLPSGFMPPVYTYTVAGATALTESPEGMIRLMQVAQALLAAVAIALMYWVGKLLFGPVAGGIAAVGYAVYPALIYQTTQVSASNLYLVLEIAALGAVIHASRHRSPAWAAAAGTLLGVVAVLRAEAVLMIVLAVVWLAWSRRRSGLPYATACVLVLAIALVLPVAWSGRNTAVLDRLTPTITTAGGLNLWLGNAEGATGGIGEPPVPRALETDLDAIPATVSYEAERDAVYRAAALDDMAADPVATIRRDVAKVLYMVTFDVNDHRARNPLALLAWGLLAVVGVLGIVRVRLDRDLQVLLLGYIGFTLVVAAMFFALGRFKLAIEYPMILFAAGYLSQRLRAPRLSG